jgi:hypothetical protein
MLLPRSKIMFKVVPVKFKLTFFPVSYIMPCHLRIKFGALALLLLLGSVGQAALILYEPMDYPALANDALLSGGGTGSGSGWTGAWTGTNTYSTSGLTHSLAINPIGGAANAVTNAGANGRPFDTTGLSANGNSQYVSFLMNFNGLLPGSNTDRFLLFSNGSNAGQGVEFGASGANGTIRTRITGTNGGTSLTFDPAQTHMVVMRLSWSDTSGADQLDIWLNPTVVGDSIGTPGLTSTGNFGSTQGTFYLRNEGNAYRFDELRMGTDLSDVVAVPEPSLLAAFGLSFLTMLHFGRARVRRS